MGNNQQNKVSTQAVTGQCRLSYVHLTTPFAQNGGEPKFSTTLLIPKSDMATKMAIENAIQAAIQQGMSKWNGVRPPMLGTPLHDGDGVRVSDGMPFGDECKGHWVMTASSKQRPRIVDLNLQDILDASQIYSGMYARVSINFFAYNSNGKKGIGCGLNNVQKLADGEALGGRSDPASDFGGAPANQFTQPAAPQGYTQPAQQYQPPVYAAPVQQYQQPAPQYQQPAYPNGVPAFPQTQQPTYPQPMQVDPITGRPINGGVMGV